MSCEVLLAERRSWFISRAAVRSRWNQTRHQSFPWKGTAALGTITKAGATASNKAVTLVPHCFHRLFCAWCSYRCAPPTHFSCCDRLTTICAFPLHTAVYTFKNISVSDMRLFPYLCTMPKRSRISDCCLERAACDTVRIFWPVELILNYGCFVLACYLRWSSRSIDRSIQWQLTTDEGGGFVHGGGSWSGEGCQRRRKNCWREPSGDSDIIPEVREWSAIPWYQWIIFFKAVQSWSFSLSRFSWVLDLKDWRVHVKHCIWSADHFLQV